MCSTKAYFIYLCLLHVILPWNVAFTQIHALCKIAFVKSSSYTSIYLMEAVLQGKKNGFCNGIICTWTKLV